MRRHSQKQPGQKRDTVSAYNSPWPSHSRALEERITDYKRLQYKNTSKIYESGYYLSDKWCSCCKALHCGKRSETTVLTARPILHDSVRLFFQDVPLAVVLRIWNCSSSADACSARRS